jgi:predicted transcriptional regulator
MMPWAEPEAAMDRQLQFNAIQSGTEFREAVRNMTTEEIAVLSDELRERMENLAEELQVLAERVIEERQRIAALRGSEGSGA